MDSKGSWKGGVDVCVCVGGGIYNPVERRSIAAVCGVVGVGFHAKAVVAARSAPTSWGVKR